jgi:hypothetical protein
MTAQAHRGAGLVLWQTNKRPNHGRAHTSLKEQNVNIIINYLQLFFAPPW